MGAPMYKMNSIVSENEDKKPDSNTIEALNKITKEKDAAEKKRLNTKTTDTEAKTVKQGKLNRKQGVEAKKQAAKDKKKAILDKPNMDLEGAVSSRKVARANKRQEMRDIRNEERGARRTDRANRSIKRIGDRNDMTVGEATKAYNTRQEALGGYKKGERGPDPANVDKQEQVDKKNTDKTLQTIQETNVAENLTGNSDKTALKTKIMDGSNFSPNQMLDGPTQQEASEDSQGISSYMNNSENRRGR